MTAIVGTINRRGVAFAADSAATHSLPMMHKITNHANKIFELSRHHPVGICICGNIDFLGMPWEEIFKMYRKSLKSTKFDNLKDYCLDFFSFVKEEIVSILTSDQLSTLTFVATQYFNEIKSSAQKKLTEIDIENPNVLASKMIEEMTNVQSIYSSRKNCEDFSDYSLDSFKTYSRSVIDCIVNPFVQTFAKPEEFKRIFVESLYYLTISDYHAYMTTTEMVFWGFGDKELFPSYYSYVVSLALDGRIKYSAKSIYEVSNLNNACVEPFAQTDVANTVIRGVDDELRVRFYDYYKSSISTFRDSILTVLTSTGAPKELINAMSSIDVDSYTKTFVKGMDQYIQESYIDKLVKTVSYLSKEDLADMAESLVRMTCLKRRITSEEESVGGPVDVAVITKGDGFVWLKRKHYFDAALNPHYFERSKE